MSMVLIVNYDRTFDTDEPGPKRRLMDYIRLHNRRGSIVFVQTKGNRRKVAAIKRWFEANGLDYNAVGDGFIREWEQ